MKAELFNARRLFAVLCAALACAGAAWAQGGDREPRAIKDSEYANQFNSCNAGAYLDNFAIELQNRPNAAGHIIVYGPGAPGNNYSERVVQATRNYLVNARGIEESRLEVVYAGRYKDLRELVTELWLVPEGAAPPPRTKYKPDYDFEGKFFERGLWDGPELGVDVGDGESWGSSMAVALAGLSEIMRRRPDARAYLVAYHGDESAPGAWRRVAEQQVEELRGYGIPTERVKTIFGGYAKEDSLQFWILPADAPPPVKEKRERRPKRSVKIATLDDTFLKYAVTERWGFKGLLDVLKADAQLTACLVVRPGPAQEKEVNPEEPDDPEEPPDVDVQQLAEKWKAELKKNGVGEHRLVVMVVPTRDEQWCGQIETWVVPPGAPLPDPSADDIIDAEEEASENP
jgi:hypothetical protein